MKKTYSIQQNFVFLVLLWVKHVVAVERKYCNFRRKKTNMLNEPGRQK